MTSIEKKMLITMGVVMVSLVFSVRSCTLMIEKNGGMRSIIIEVGKEVKEISKEINKG